MNPVDLAHAAALLRRLDEEAIQEGVSRHRLELELSPDGREYSVRGNAEGLLHVARNILEVLVRGFDGAHHHFDETGIIDRCNVPLTVTLRSG